MTPLRGRGTSARDIAAAVLRLLTGSGRRSSAASSQGTDRWLAVVIAAIAIVMTVAPAPASAAVGMECPWFLATERDYNARTSHLVDRHGNNTTVPFESYAPGFRDGVVLTGDGLMLARADPSEPTAVLEPTLLLPSPDGQPMLPDVGWSPDGSWLLVGAYGTSTRLVHLPTRRVEILAGYSMTDSSTMWSPTSRHAVLRREGRLVVLDITGESPAFTASPAPDWSSFLGWSSDGGWLATSLKTEASDSSPIEVSVHERDGSGVQVVASVRGARREIQIAWGWRPQSSELHVVEPPPTGSGPATLAVFDGATQSLSRHTLPTMEWISGPLSFSADGARSAWSAGTQLWRREATTGLIWSVTPAGVKPALGGPYILGPASMAPNGQLVGVQAIRESGEFATPTWRLWAEAHFVDDAGSVGLPETLVEGGVAADYLLSPRGLLGTWSPDGSAYVARAVSTNGVHGPTVAKLLAVPGARTDLPVWSIAGVALTGPVPVVWQSCALRDPAPAPSNGSPTTAEPKATSDAPASMAPATPVVAAPVLTG